MALIEGLEGSGKPLLHTSGSSVIADNARDDYASNQIFEDDGPFTPVPTRPIARLSINSCVMQPSGIRSVVLCNTNIYGIGKGLHRESVQVPVANRASSEKRYRPIRGTWCQCLVQRSH